MQKTNGFCPNKDSLSSIFCVLWSDSLQTAGDGRIELASGTGKWQVGEVTARTAGMGNQQDRHHKRRGCPSSRRVGTKVRRLGCCFLQQGYVRFRWNARIGRLLLVCFVFTSWPSASTIPGRIAEDTPIQGWRHPSLIRAESGTDTFEDQPQVVRSQRKRFSGEHWPQKVGSQSERLLMARSITREELLCERIVQWGARVIWK